MVGLSLLSMAQGITAVGDGLERCDISAQSHLLEKGTLASKAARESSEGLILKNQCCLLGTSRARKTCKRKVCLSFQLHLVERPVAVGASREEERHTQKNEAMQ